MLGLFGFVGLFLLLFWVFFIWWLFISTSSTSFKDLPQFLKYVSSYSSKITFFFSLFHKNACNQAEKTSQIPGMMKKNSCFLLVLLDNLRQSSFIGFGSNPVPSCVINRILHGIGLITNIWVPTKTYLEKSCIHSYFFTFSSKSSCDKLPSIILYVGFIIFYSCSPEDNSVTGPKIIQYILTKNPRNMNHCRNISLTRCTLHKPMLTYYPLSISH